MHRFLAAVLARFSGRKADDPRAMGQHVQNANRRKKTDKGSIVRRFGGAGALQLTLVLFKMAVCVRRGVASGTFETRHPKTTMVPYSIETISEDCFKSQD